MIVSWLACSVQKHKYSSKQQPCKSMGEIAFKIRPGQEDLTLVYYDSPLSVAQTKQTLLEENTSWIQNGRNSGMGALQEAGSSRRVRVDSR